jgi:hypothetical protein
MALFRLFLAFWIIVIAGYTSVTIANHGLNLLPIFFGDMAQMAWPGQFNLDFLSFLTLGGLWLAWRHHFSAGGIALWVFIYAGGMPFLATYLIVQSYRANGDMKIILLGERRASVQ